MIHLGPIQDFAAFEHDALALIQPRFASKFGAVTWDQMDAPGPQHKWLVKGLLTEGELSMLAGASASGKSFLMIDLAMAVAQGQPWFGRKVAKGGVIYQAGEGAAGLRRKRIPAYRRHNDLSASDDIPFVLLPGRVNLWDGAAHTADLIAEIKHWAGRMADPLKLIIIDTLAKAMTGGDEISGKDMGMVFERCEMIRAETGATVLLGHHMNAIGEKVRGHTSIKANLESVLVCRMATMAGGRGQPDTPITDTNNRKVRELVIDKAKEGESDIKPFRFVLRAVEIGRDEDGDPVTSCVVQPPAGEEIERRESGQKKQLNVKLSIALRALTAATEKLGRFAPAHVENPPQGPNCVTLAEWRDEMALLIAGESEDPDALKERTKKARDRAADELINRNYIRKAGDWVWRTGRRVPGIDREPPAPPPPPDNDASLGDVPW